MPLSLNIGNKKHSMEERLNMKQADVLHVTATTDAETIGDNKVISQSIEVPYVFSISGGSSMIHSITVIDATATGPAIDIVFSTSESNITQDEGKAVGEDVADLDTILESCVGHVSLAASDYTDLFDSKLGTKSNINLVVRGPSNSTSLYMHIINRSGANWVATAVGNMKVKIGVMKD